jgi:hypothetical protein
LFRNTCYPENVERLRALMDSFSRSGKLVTRKHPRKKRNDDKVAPATTK